MTNVVGGTRILFEILWGPPPSPEALLHHEKIQDCVNLIRMTNDSCRHGDLVILLFINSELCSLISENEIKRQRSIIRYLLDDLGDALIASAEQVEISFVHRACLWDTESTFKD